MSSFFGSRIRTWQATRNFIMALLCVTVTTFIQRSHASDVTNVTGSYGIVGTCSDKDMEDNPGEIYVRHCFLGEKYVVTASMWLVQNGNSVCGYYSECGGFNCGKVYMGQMIGRVTGNTLTLFAESGHQEEGVAETRVFKVVPGGLSEGHSKTGKPTYVQRARELKEPSVAKACKPDFPKEVRLKNYELDVSGILATEKVKFLNHEREAKVKPPAAKRFNLSKLASMYEWEDKRDSSNYVPRLVSVRNDSKKAWTVSTGHPETCREFLSYGGSPKEQSRVSVEAQFGGVEVKPGKSIDFLSCKGSTWTFEDKVACPRFTCLEGCKC